MEFEIIVKQKTINHNAQNRQKQNRSTGENQANQGHIKVRVGPGAVISYIAISVGSNYKDIKTSENAGPSKLRTWVLQHPSHLPNVGLIQTLPTENNNNNKNFFINSN